ncbi:MAG: ATP-binding protein, partial [Candidatus Eremiobacterota bacterium]
MNTLLPRPPESFLGREAELSRLGEYFPHRNLFVLKGIAGIGKTSLALAFLRGRSEPCLYLQCLSGEGLEELCSELGASLGLQPADMDGGTVREKLLVCLKRLNQQNHVLVIDDVHALPGKQLATLIRLFQTYLTARVLLISREELPLGPLDRVDIFEEKLERLDPESSIALLEGLFKLHSGQHPAHQEMERMAVAVDGHPLLLKLLAGLWLDRRLEVDRVTPETLKPFLASHVLGQVDPEARGVLEVLSLSPVPLALPIVQRCATACEDTVRRLEQRFLLDRQPDGRMRVHQLL